jgi:hypothetical protein
MIAAMAASLEQNRQLADLRAQLITAHGEAEERMRERDEARSEVERWRAIAEKCGIDAEKNRIRLQAALARKQRVIDDACRVYMSVGRLDPDTAHRMHAAICHEATPTYAESPVGSEQPTRLGSVGNDPLQVEWEADGFRITAMPEEWRGDFIETHEGVSVSSAACPLWCEPDSLWLRGNNRKKDNSLVLVPEADRLRVMAAIASVNAKHRKASPTIETVAEYLKSGELGNPSETPKSSAEVPGHLESESDELEPAKNPAKVAESDGTKALRLVAELAECIRTRTVAPRVSWRSEMGAIQPDWRAEINAIIVEARGGAE